MDQPITTCTIDGCGKPHTARGYCAGHYRRWRTGKKVEGPLQVQIHKPRPLASECFNGHPYPENLIVTPRGHRKCRKCQNEYQRRHYSKNAEAVVRKNEARRLWGIRNPDYSSKYYAANKEREQARKRFQLYGITQDEFEAMWTQQGSACAICRTDLERGRTNGFHIDHDHKSLKVRGILCGRCNRMLGYLEGPHVNAAYAYLERQGSS